jgi:hypothetical protein
MTNAKPLLLSTFDILPQIKVYVVRSVFGKTENQRLRNMFRTTSVIIGCRSGFKSLDIHFFFLIEQGILGKK